MTIVEHHSAEELQRLFRQEKNARVAQRIWIAWQARLGRIEPQITAAIGWSRRSVQNWVQRYHEEGLTRKVSRDCRTVRGEAANRSCPKPSSSSWSNAWKKDRARTMSVRCEVSTFRSSWKSCWES